MFENDFIVEFNDKELGECRTYPKNFKGYEQTIKDLKLYKAKQNQRIAELEEQLKNSVRPKFKVNDKIFVIVNGKIEEYHIDEVLLKSRGTLVAYRDICEETTITEKNEIFANKEDAEARLKELQGE